MNWKKFILPPFIIYAVIFLFISALVGEKVDQNSTWVWVVTLIIDIVGLYLAAMYSKPKNTIKGFLLGLIWLVLIIILDLVLTRPFTGLEYFSDWKTWLTYALTILIPTIYSKIKR